MPRTDATRRERRLPPEGDPLRYAFWVRPQCPQCQSFSMSATRGVIDHNDGTTEQRMECDDCGARFIAVGESRKEIL